MEKLLCLSPVIALLYSAVPVFAAKTSHPIFALDTPQMAVAEKTNVCAVSSPSANSAGETPLVNSGKSEICAVLVNDIVINEDPEASVQNGQVETLYIFTPIATDVVYDGTFDGNNHTIIGLYCHLHLDQEELEDAHYILSDIWPIR